MQHFPCFCRLKGCTSSHGTWDQLSHQMTSLLCSDQMFQMAPLTCLSSGKQVFFCAQQCQQVPTQSSVFIPLLLPVTVLFITASFSLVNDTSPRRLQEVNSMLNKRLKDVLFSDQWSELCMDTLSPFGYVLVSTELHTVDYYIII